MTPDWHDTLIRIANALERQVEQVDQTIARQLEMRQENITRHERERDAELEVSRQMNAELMARLDRALALQPHVQEPSDVE